MHARFACSRDRKKKKVNVMSAPHANKLLSAVCEICISAHGISSQTARRKNGPFLIKANYLEPIN